MDRESAGNVCYAIMAAGLLVLAPIVALGGWMPTPLELAALLLVLGINLGLDTYEAWQPSTEAMTADDLEVSD